MMIKQVDVGLMANHLAAHNPVIKRLEMYSTQTNNESILTILNKQIGIMRNHVQVMNLLLDPNQKVVNLPPIPDETTNDNQTSPIPNFQMGDKDLVMDAHFTSSAMAKENFNSSENMKNPQVKEMHREMAMQQSTITAWYEQIMEQMGWTNQPTASTKDQSETITPLESTMPAPMMQDDQNINNNNPDQIN